MNSKAGIRNQLEILPSFMNDLKKSTIPPGLQIALDTGSTADALRLLDQVHLYIDIVEIGTPLIIEQGLKALEMLKTKYPAPKYLADLKIMDAGYIEAASAFRRGANILTVLGLADDSTIKGALRAANEYDGSLMIDLINVPNLAERAQQLEAMGAHILCVHTAFDRQQVNVNPLAELERLRPIVSCGLAAAGGLTIDTVGHAIVAGADIVVVGGGITNQDAPGDAAAAIAHVIKESRRDYA